jgi:hypothetical protein
MKPTLQTFWERRKFGGMLLGQVHKWTDENGTEHLCVKVASMVRSVMTVDKLTGEYHFTVRKVYSMNELLAADMGLR